MLLFHPLPWEYAIRNLLRRPLRTFLTFATLTTIVLMVVVVVGFLRGLERSLTVTGDSQVALVFALGMGENLEYSSIDMSTGDLIAASVEGIQERYGQKYVSPELFMGTETAIAGNDEKAMALVRGVTPAALLVRRQVELEAGNWPRMGEIMVGRLAATKLGVDAQHLTVGQTLRLEDRDWKISGTFSAAGAAYESELWCRLDDLQQAMKRQDLSIVAVTLEPRTDFSVLELFCLERLDLELQAVRESEYYATLQKDYGPVRTLAWLVVVLITCAGIFAGLNTMYGSVIGRIREFASLQTVGFVRRAIILSLLEEGIVLGAAASLLAAVVALTIVSETAVRFTMGAFALRIDNVTVLIGCGIGLLMGIVGALPPAMRILKVPIVDGLKAT
jgi:putative ABC transport system permease protein